LLRAIAEDIRDGILERNRHYVLDEKYLHIAYPGIAEHYSRDAAQVVSDLDEQRLLVIDPMKPNMKVQTIELGKRKFKGLTLHKKISDAARKIIESGQSQKQQELAVEEQPPMTLEEILKGIEHDKRISSRDKQNSAHLWVNSKALVAWYSENSNDDTLRYLLPLISGSNRTIQAGEKRVVHKKDGEDFYLFNWPEKA